MRASIFLALLLITLLGNAQIKESSFEELDSLKTNSQNTVVYIHTDWCKYCSKMKNTTFKDQEVIKLLNNSFNFISFNAESKENINFNGHTFSFIPNGTDVGYHELATALGTIDGELNFPSICILNPDYEIIFQYAGTLNAKALQAVLQRLLKS